jgi:hypothetical protein
MSSRSWVVRITVVPSVRLSSRRKSRTAALASTSRPMVGSSRNSTWGAGSTAAASSARIRWPSDSDRTGTSSSGPRASTSSRRRSRATRSAAGMRYRCPTSSNDSARGRSHQSWVRCPNTTPRCLASRLRSR